jgi:hypothetical protein
VAAEFQPEEILAVLDRHDVTYVLISGYAALLHGSTLPTTDIDITSRRDRVSTGLSCEAIGPSPAHSSQTQAVSTAGGAMAVVLVTWTAPIPCSADGYARVPRRKAAAKWSQSGSPLVRTTVRLVGSTRKVQPPRSAAGAVDPIHLEIPRMVGQRSGRDREEARFRARCRTSATAAAALARASTVSMLMESVTSCA